MGNLGIVFAGGGGKGAYEIGVWKYLHEIGIERYVSAVSGTSVGALNAALFACGDYGIAEGVWKNITSDQILKKRPITITLIANRILRNFYIGAVFNNIINIGEAPYMFYNVNRLFNALNNNKGKKYGLFSNRINQSTILSELLSELIAMIGNDYIFSRDGLRKLINTGIDFNKIRKTKVECSVTCFNCSTFEPEYFDLNGRYKEDVTKLLLASSAIPIVFSKEMFYGVKYCDGGLPLIGNNIPIEPLYERKIKNIIVVHLDKDKFVDKRKYPDSNIIEISPSRELGNFIDGTLDFNPQNVDERIDLGYEDAKKILESLV